MTEQNHTSSFRERFELAAFEDGGVVVDLATGYYSRLNASGAMILGEFARVETTEGAVSTVANRLGIPRALASEHLASLIAALAREGLRTEPIDSFRYRPSEGGGYDLWHGARRVLHVDEQGSALTLLAPAQGSRRPNQRVRERHRPEDPVLDGCHRLARFVLGQERFSAGNLRQEWSWQDHNSKNAREACWRADFGGSSGLRPGPHEPGHFRERRSSRPRVVRPSVQRVRGRPSHRAHLRPDPRGIGCSYFPAVSLVPRCRPSALRLTIRELSRADALGLITANQFLGAAGGQNWRASCGLVMLSPRRSRPTRSTCRTASTASTRRSEPTLQIRRRKTAERLEWDQDQAWPESGVPSAMRPIWSASWAAPASSATSTRARR